MRELTVDYGDLDYDTFRNAVVPEITLLVNECDNFLEFDKSHITKDGQHGISVKMVLYQSARLTPNGQRHPSKSTVSFTAFRRPLDVNGLLFLSFKIDDIYVLKPFHDETSLI